MAELLQDADLLVRRFEQVDQSIAERIEKASGDAAGKAFLAFKLNFESAVEKDVDKLLQAGRYAAAQIGNQLNTQSLQLAVMHEAFERKAYRLMALVTGTAFVAGALGGVIGAKLVGA
ncbi:hypothetical protein [Comamonas antarctica]|uniref:Uncharacterized protein n=1 Tax=Comamonas antarctica TaxID=2743470 RepID=A0A6N1X929_9BURK|nr:hypothetical protein [Comamonas antarctica]QKV55817.1 hypothetical protein HUK68_22355 [Comamonas antarctica]